MRRAYLWLLAAGACSDTTDPGTQYYNLSQAQAEAVAEVVVAGGVGPILDLAPATVSTGTIQVPLAASTACPRSGVTSLSGILQGTAAGGAASLLVSAAESAGKCVIELEARTYEVNSIQLLSVGGFINYLDGALVANQTLFISGTVQVIGDQNAQAICPVDLTVTITNWSPDVRVQGNLCGRGIDRIVAV